MARGSGAVMIQSPPKKQVKYCTENPGESLSFCAHGRSLIPHYHESPQGRKRGGRMPNMPDGNRVVFGPVRQLYCSNQSCAFLHKQKTWVTVEHKSQKVCVGTSSLLGSPRRLSSDGCRPSTR